jgi:hypothetical protein
VAKRSAPSHQVNAVQRRIAVTSAYLRVICPGIDRSKRSRLVDSILALIDGEDRRLRQNKISDGQAVEMVWRHSQCVLNHTGRCPLLIFNKQLAEEINEFFAQEERSRDAF